MVEVLKHSVKFPFFSLSPQSVKFYRKFDSGPKVINSLPTAIACSYTGSLCLGEELYFPVSVTACQDMDEEPGNSNKHVENVDTDVKTVGR